MFKKNRYQVVRNAIPIEVASFVHDYFLNKKQVHRIFKDTKYISMHPIEVIAKSYNLTWYLIINY